VIALEESLLKGHDYKAIYFEMNIDVLVSRLTARRVCSNCNAIFNLISMPPKEDGVCDKCKASALYQRKDDSEEVVKNRMEVFSNTINPVLDYYSKKGKLVKVDAAMEMDSVYSQLKNLVNN